MFLFKIQFNPYSLFKVNHLLFSFIFDFEVNNLHLNKQFVGDNFFS